MAKLDLQVQKQASAGVKFPATVSIDSGPPGAVVTVTLEQPRAPPPRYSDTRETMLDVNGAGNVPFDVILNGKGFKTLLAHATDGDVTFYRPDAETVQVL